MAHRSRATLHSAGAVIALALFAAAAHAAEPRLVFSAENASRFVGRTHAIMVHFPIALLLVGAMLEIFAAVRQRLAPSIPRDGAPRSAVSDAGLVCIAIGAIGAAAAAGAGWLNAHHEGVSSAAENMVEWHRWLGVGVVGVAILAALVGLAARAARSFPLVAAYRAGTVLAAAAVGVTGHLGGSMVYGEDYLIAAFRYRSAPAVASDADSARPPSTSTSTLIATQTAPTATAVASSSSPAFTLTARAQEIFDAKCIDCHGSRRSKGDLRLDDVSAQPPSQVISASDPDSSELLRRITLPPNHKQFMPEDGDPLPAAEIAAIRDWLRSRSPVLAAATPATSASAPPPSATTPPADPTPTPAAAATTTAPPTPSRVREQLPRVELTAEQRQAQARAIAAIRSLGGHASPVASNSDLIRVNLTPMGKACTDRTLASLAGLESSLHDLSLAGTAVTDDALSSLAPFAMLARLDLSRTAITDEGVRRLAGLPRLRSLNLHTSKITDGVAETLTSMPVLTDVVLWRTAMTPDVARRLAEAKPDLRVEFGIEAPQPAPQPTPQPGQQAAAPADPPAAEPATPATDAPPLLARLPGCCKAAKDAGRECDHPCCVSARAAGKVCEKCLGG